MDIKALLHRMTLEEKASLCIGGSYMHTLRIPRLNIPNIRMSDGPSGINKTIIYQDYLLPEEESKESILFPSSSCTCCSFDKDLMYYMGENFGDQMIKEGISIIFAPQRGQWCEGNFRDIFFWWRLWWSKQPKFFSVWWIRLVILLKFFRFN